MQNALYGSANKILGGSNMMRSTDIVTSADPLNSSRWKPVIRFRSKYSNKWKVAITAGSFPSRQAALEEAESAIDTVKNNMSFENRQYVIFEPFAERER